MAHNYRVQPGLDGWPAKSNLKVWYDVAAARVFDVIQQKVTAGTLTPGEAGGEYYHEVLKIVAAEHPRSLKYVREERKSA